jgi:hypothetical protein
MFQPNIAPSSTKAPTSHINNNVISNNTNNRNRYEDYSTTTLDEMVPLTSCASKLSIKEVDHYCHPHSQIPSITTLHDDNSTANCGNNQVVDSYRQKLSIDERLAAQQEAKRDVINC